MLLTTTQKTDFATRAVPLLRTDDNATRDGLKAIARDCVNTMMDANAKATYKNNTGMSINRTIDMVPREVLIACVGLSVADRFDVFIERLTEAMQDDNVCMPKQRGSGVARGYHKLFDRRPSFEQNINNIVSGSTTNVTNEPSTQVLIACETMLILREADPNCDVPLRDVITTGVDKGIFTTEDRYGLRGTARTLLENGYESTFDTMDDDAQSAVGALVAALGGRKKTVVTPTANEPVAIDPSFAPAIDQLLKQASGGKVSAIGDLLAQQATLSKSNATLTEEIERLRQSASVAKPVQQTGEVGDLTYEVVMKKASDLFTDKRGRKSSKLDFDVVTLEWKNSNGDVVRHPMCPEVDDTYQFRMWHLIRFLSAMKFGQNVWLHGHTGTGKTTLAMQIAARLGIPVERLNLDSNIERSDMVGATNIVVKDGAPVTEFSEGILPRAMRQPCWMILDELDAGRADALFAIQRVLEGNGLTLTEQGGQVVEQHELFRIVATANSRGQGDEHGWYAGVRPMNLAMLNRFGAFIEVPYLDKDDEIELLKRAYPALKPKDREEMAGYAELVREAFKNGEISQTISPRNLHSMAMYFMHYGNLMPTKEAMHEAVRTTVIDSAPADNAQRLEELYQRVFGVV